MAFEPQNDPATQTHRHAKDTLFGEFVDRLNSEYALMTDTVRADHAAMKDDVLAIKNRLEKHAWYTDPNKREGLDRLLGLQKIVDMMDRSEDPWDSVADETKALAERVSGIETLVQEAEHRRPPQGMEALDPRAEYIKVHAARLMDDPRLRAAAAVDPRLSLEYNALTARYLRKGDHSYSAEQQQLSGLVWSYMEQYLDNERFHGEFTPELMNAIRPDFTPGAGLFISPTIDARIREKLVEFSAILGLSPRTPVGSDTAKWMQETGALPTAGVVSPHAAGGTANTNEELWEERKADVFPLVAEIPIIRAMLDDSTRDLLGLMTNLVGRRFAKILSQWVVTGSGAGQPWGVANDSGVTTVPTGLADEVTLHSLLFLSTQLPAFYRRNAQYVVGEDAYTAAVVELDADNRPKWNPSTSAGTPPTLYGYAISSDTYYQSADTVTAEKVTFTASDVVGTFADWSQFTQMFERHGTRFLRTESAKPGESQQIDTAWYQRIGFAVDLHEAGRNLVVNA